ncbi:isochorismatase family cysteine hydrolase [Segnochrobactrum spirostomi]|uniref:Cysteine hydrolase n=1 Tax=Segnochrobactrum spirostomi TaxID=2608987 RepID=A0A6A7Y2L0_9HYPH|nr:isochorismatase family cysteine hydrolase [Segnochrobactrum spirostomi]MQT13320.1 cysteine hydrolase [Segnochrobactrum spirostomi]
MPVKDLPVLSFARPPAAPHLVSFPAAPQHAEIDLARTALLVIDMQKDFLHPDGWFPRLGFDPTPLTAIVPKLDVLAKAARRAGVQVIWLNWGVRADRAELSPMLIAKASAGGTRPVYADTLVPGHGGILVASEWGAELVDELVPEAGDLVVHKHRLSGFYDNDLDSILRNRGIDTLIFSGTNTDRCVFSTLCDANFRGYGCLMVEDACATGSPASVSEAIHYLVRLTYGVTLTSDDLLAAFASASA